MKKKNSYGSDTGKLENRHLTKCYYFYYHNDFHANFKSNFSTKLNVKNINIRKPMQYITDVLVHYNIFLFPSLIIVFAFKVPNFKYNIYYVVCIVINGK